MPDHGIHEAVPFDQYLAWPCASQSRLKWLKRSAAYCRWRIEHPEEKTGAQAFGTACHLAILEPDLFEARYAMLPAVDLRTKAGKEAKRAVEESGKEPMKPDEYSRVCAIRDAVHASPAAVALLKREIRREVSAAWIDPATELDCKARLDIFADDLIGDLKITKDAHPDAFERFVTKFGTHMQAAWYLAGLRALGRKPVDFVVVAVEPLPPHEVCVYALEENALRAGAEENRRLMERYARCVRTSRWPGYPLGVQSVDLPDWYLRNVFPEEYQ